MRQMKSAQYLEEMFGLKGKTAVIIGGTGELCSYMALGLAQAGAEVVLVGRNEEKAKLDSVVAQSGKVDILINGAGINSPSPFVEITDEEALEILNVNLVGVMRACQVFGNYFLSRDVPDRKVLDESRVAEILRHTPSSRFGNPHELIGATILLASNRAGSFITGSEIVVDGGFNSMTI